MATKIEIIPKILKGLDATNKYRSYLILLENRKPMTIPEIQKELEDKFNEKLAYGSIQSLLESMHRAGIIEFIEERPRKVRLLKKIDITIEDISEDTSVSDILSESV